MKRYFTRLFTFLIAILLVANSQTLASRDDIKCIGETTLFSEDFEGYDGPVSLANAYGRRLDDWAHGTIYYEGNKYLDTALVEGFNSENAALTCEKMATSNSRRFVVEVPMGRWSTSGTVHIKANIKPQASVGQDFCIYEGLNSYKKTIVLDNATFSSYIGTWLDIDLYVNLDSDSYTGTLKNASNGSTLKSLQGTCDYDSIGGFVINLSKSDSSSWSDVSPIIDNIYIGAQTREADKDVFEIESYSITDSTGNFLTTLTGATNIDAKLNIKAGKNISRNSQIFAVVYDINDKVKEISSTKQTFKEGYQAVSVNLNLSEAISSTDTVYLYVWDASAQKPFLTKFNTDNKVITQGVADDFDIHNDVLKNYLNDSYDSCGNYATGEKAIDAPRPLTFNWASDTGYSSYILRVSENSDMSDAWEYESYTTDYDVFNLKVGTTYYWTVTARNGDQNVYTTRPKSFTTYDQAPRNLYIQGGLANIRDVGGWQTTDGSKTQQGLVYRSRCFEYLENGSLKTRVNSYGIDEMTERLGIKTEIDFRSVEQDGAKYPTNQANTLNIQYCQVPLNLDDDYLSNNKAALKKIFSILAYDENYPVVYHCSVGADRTGLVTWLLNGLLGVTKDDLYRDYLITNFHSNDTNRSVDSISSKYVAVLDNYTGSNLQQKVYNYLSTEVGVSTDKLDHIIYIMKNGLGETPNYGESNPIFGDKPQTLYSEDFESAVSESTNYAKNGGWSFDSRDDEPMVGYGTGYNSNTGFYPTWVPGRSTARNETRSSEYFLSPADVKTTGKYVFSFDFYKGSNANTNPIRIGSGRSYSEEDSETVVNLYYSKYADNNKWENVVIEINAETKAYSLKITKPDGTTKIEESGTLSISGIDYISFGVKAGNTKSGSANTDESGFYSKIDNFTILYSSN